MYLHHYPHHVRLLMVSVLYNLLMSVTINPLRAVSGFHATHQVGRSHSGIIIGTTTTTILPNDSATPQPPQRHVLLHLSDNQNDWYSDYNPETYVAPPPRYDNSNSNNKQYSNDRDRFRSSNDNNYSDRRGDRRGGGRGGGGRGGRGGRGGGGGGGSIIYERDTSMDQSNVDVAAVERLLDDRQQARRQNDFDRADDIRDTLLQQYGVQVWDKDGVWRTGASASGSGLNRRSSRDGGGGRFGRDSDRGRGGRFGDRGGRSPRRPKDFGPTGHDYEMAPDAGAIAVDVSESEIHEMIAARLRAKMSRNFDEADEIQAQLTDAGIYVHDARKEWRADGIMFGDYANSDGRPGQERGSRRDREMAPFEQSPYSAGIDTLTEDEMSDITRLVSQRNGAKLSRNYQTADRIRDELKAEYNVFIEDRLRQWSIGGDFGPDSPARDASRFKPWTMSSYSEPLIDEDQESAILVQLEERNEAKAARNFDAADDIRDFLLSEFNVAIDDRLREWSIGGNFGMTNKASRNDDTYRRRGGGDLTPEDEAEIIDLVAMRAKAKKNRDFNTSDELREVLDERFAVKVDDKTKEWWVKTANYSLGRSSGRLAESLDDETIAFIQDQLQERLELKNEKQYEAADEIRDELQARFGITIDDRMQEWNIEVDQFTVVNNDRRPTDFKERQEQNIPPSYSLEEEYSDDADDDEAEEDFNDSFAAVFDSESDVTASTSSDGTDLETLTIPELKEQLRALGLPVSGKKSELIERLTQSLL